MNDLIPYSEIRNLLESYKLVKTANHRPELEPMDEKGLQAFCKMIKAEKDGKLQMKAYLLALYYDDNPEARKLFQDILEAI